MDFIFLYAIIHVTNLLFNDVICVYLSVSFYSITFIANRKCPENTLLEEFSERYIILMHKTLFWLVKTINIALF